MSVFRVEKTKNYTVMSNYHLKDTSLSYKARGILSTILSLLDNWDYTLIGLAAISKDGVASVRADINELEAARYIVRIQSRDSKGLFDKNVYNVYEIPHKEPKPLENKDIQPLCKNHTTEVSPSCDFPITDNPSTGNPLSENSTQLNINISNTDKSNTDKSNTEVSNTQSILSYPDRIDMIEKYTELIKQNIDYAALTSYKNQSDKERVDEIVSIMAETVAFSNKSIYINGNIIPSEVVKSRLLKLDFEDIQYVLIALSHCTSKIGNIKAYLLATLYNAKSTRANYYSTEIQRDLFGSKST